MSKKTSIAIAPPPASKEPTRLNEHGQTRIDDYAWLRLSEEQRTASDPDERTRKVISHLQAENTYTETVLDSVKDLRESLFQEMKARVKEDDLSVPYRENGYWYSFRFEEGRSTPSTCVHRSDRKRTACLRSFTTCWTRMRWPRGMSISIWPTSRSHRATA